MDRVRVTVPGRGYDVTVGPGLLEEAGAHLPELPGAERAFVDLLDKTPDLWHKVARTLAERLGDNELGNPR